MRRIRAQIHPDLPGLPFTETAEIRTYVEAEPVGAERVFISHKTGDYDDAKAVVARLLDYGLPVYFTEDDPNVASGNRGRIPNETKDTVRRSVGLLVFALTGSLTSTPPGSASRSASPRCTASQPPNIRSLHASPA